MPTIVVGNEFRVVQFTPPGSPASIHFGTGTHIDRTGLGSRSLFGRV